MCHSTLPAEVARSRVREERLRLIQHIFCGALLYREKAELETLDVLPAATRSWDRVRRSVRQLTALVGKRHLLQSQLVKDEDGQVLHMEMKQWLEAIDPLRRAGGDLKHYHRHWLQSDTKHCFFHWLDRGDGAVVDLDDCPRNQLDAGKVRYCTLVERAAFQVDVVDGLLRYRQSGELLDGSLIFVMSTSGELFMNKKMRGRFHHSSFLAGNPVLVAGTAVLQMGRFVRLFPYSGHYRPKAIDFRPFVLRLCDQGLVQEQVDFLEVEVRHPDFCDKRKRGKGLCPQVS